MLILLLCEGQNEEALMNLLLEKNKLKFNRQNLIGRRPYHARKINNGYFLPELRSANDKVKIYRIGDKQSDKLEIPASLSEKIDGTYNYCTKPEMEILLIINEGKFKDYKKVSSLKKPSTYAKENIKYNGKKYNKSCEFIYNYYGGKNVDNLVKNINEYKNIKSHNKDELYLADLLK